MDDHSLASRLGLVVLTALALAVAFYVHLLFLREYCWTEGGARIAARASLQGQFCGEQDSPVSLVLLAFGSAAVTAVIVLVTWWRKARDWVGKAGSLVLPAAVFALVWALLTLPPDHCSQDTRQRVSAGACASRLS